MLQWVGGLVPLAPKHSQVVVLANPNPQRKKEQGQGRWQIAPSTPTTGEPPKRVDLSAHGGKRWNGEQGESPLTWVDERQRTGKPTAQATPTKPPTANRELTDPSLKATPKRVDLSAWKGKR